MIDTIIFQIYDLRKHEDLVRILERDGVEGISTYVKTVEKTNVDIVGSLSENLPSLADDQKLRYLESLVDEYKQEKQSEDFERVKRIHNKRYAHDHGTGKDFRAKYVNHLRSSHYELAYRIQYDQDFIYFNFSIPKYLYGSNVLQFVPHFFDNDYRPAVGNYDEIESLTYDRFKKFLNWFFQKELGGFVSLSEVRIIQLDLCFNKVFNTKQESLFYLAELKRIRKKWLRDTSKGEKSYHSGIFFPGSEITQKIYHKGSEFRNNDRQEVKKFIDQSGIEVLQDFADRILRYELSFRQPYFDRIYKDKIFRSKSTTWKKAKKIFRALTSNGYIKKDGKKVHAVSLNSEDKILYKFAKHIYSKRFYYMLKSSSTFSEDDAPMSLTQFDRYAKFNRALFQRLQKRFREFMDFFTVTYKHDFFNIVGQIESTYKLEKQRSEELRRRYLALGGSIPIEQLEKISCKTAKFIVSYLSNKSTWKDILDDDVLSRSKYYLYKKFLSTFGIGEVAAIKDFAVGSTDFRDYYEVVERDYRSFGIDGILRSKV